MPEEGYVSNVPTRMTVVVDDAPALLVMAASRPAHAQRLECPRPILSARSTAMPHRCLYQRLQRAISTTCVIGLVLLARAIDVLPWGSVSPPVAPPGLTDTGDWRITCGVTSAVMRRPAPLHQGTGMM